MRKVLIFFILSILISCQESDKNIVVADLTFKSISFNSAYGGTQKQVEELNRYIDSIGELSNPKTGDKEIADYFNKLKENDLFNLPYIFLLVEKDSVITVHLEESEYTKVKDFSQKDLFEDKKKVELEIELKQLDSDLFYSDQIIRVSKIDGRSHSNL